MLFFKKLNAKFLLNFVPDPPIIHVNISLQKSFPRSDLFSIQKGSKKYFNENQEKNYDYSKILVTAVEGQEISMDCFCDSKPPVENSDIKWKKRLQKDNGSSTTAPQDLSQFPIRMSYAGTESMGSRLLFKSVSQSDQWTYVCLCRNFLQPYNLSPFNAYARKEVSLNVLCELSFCDLINVLSKWCKQFKQKPEGIIV